MTSTYAPLPVAPRSPLPVLAVRVLVGLQAMIAFWGLAVLGLIVAWGIGLAVVWDFDNPGALAALIALFGVLLAFVCRLLGASSRLRRGQESARTSLVAMQAVLLAGVLLLTGVAGDVLDFDGFPAPAIVLGATSIAALVALLSGPTRRWCRR